ncbi:MAG: mechanosensitive ion channel family protein [bacterium]|nr:mechanosensitive ion channel family protein [bacterium]
MHLGSLQAIAIDLFAMNSVLQLSLAACTLLVGTVAALLLVRGPFVTWLDARIESRGEAARLERVVAAHARPTIVPLLAVLALSASLRLLDLPSPLEHVIGAIVETAILFAIVRIVSSLVSAAAGRLHALVPIVQVTIWLIACVVLLENFGVRISTLVAGLGIGGVAVALGAQAVLKDAFAYVAIVVDRPFEIGDFILSGTVLGSIEQVGIKTTRIRSLSGEQLVLANATLTDQLVHNFKRMHERRVQFRFGVIYDTPNEILRAIPGRIREAIETLADTRFERAHFVEFGASSLDFEVAYYVLSPDYALYMDIQQEINLRIKEIVVSAGSDFAFPSLTLYPNGNGAQSIRASDQGLTLSHAPAPT